MEDLYKYERELYEKGLHYIGGVDEVGRGPLIGSVVAACVVLPDDFVLEGYKLYGAIFFVGIFLGLIFMRHSAPFL